MQEKLIIYLHAEDLEHPSWAVLDKQLTVRQSAQYDDAQGLADIAEEKEVIVVVPAQDITLLLAHVPKMNRARLGQALPFALEENLVEEVQLLHFAYDQYNAEGKLPVAVVSHTTMLAWLDLIKRWAIKPDSFVPACYAIPFEDQKIHVAIDHMATVRLNLYQGFACDPHNLQDLLGLTLGDQNVSFSQIEIHNYTQQPISLCLPIEIKEHLAIPAQAMIDYAGILGKAAPINLLQGRYATKKSKFPQKTKLLKTAVAFGILSIILLFLYPSVSYVILKQRANLISAEIAEIYRYHFPKATSVVAPKMRMEEKLRHMTSEPDENRFFTLLSLVAKSITDMPAIKLSRLDFQNHQLTLELTSNNSEDLTAFTTFLQHQGLNVKQQNANLSGANMSMTLLID